MDGDYCPMNSFEKNLGSQDSSGLGSGPRAKGDRTRRSWSTHEEEILMWSMKDLVAHGWKVTMVSALCLFGKDRITRGVTEDTYDAFDSLARQTQSQLHDEGLEFPFKAKEFSVVKPNPQQGPRASSYPGWEHQTEPEWINANQKKWRKRKAASDNVGLIEMFGRMQNDTNERLDKLTNRIGFEFEASSKARKEVVDILSVIPELTLLQQIDIAEIILDKVERFEHFMRLPERSCLTNVSSALEKHRHI
ncbi:hypothetical protein AAHA92_20796 [Salvia divinorum]|uniref:Myb-like domain-containing protein n=1 Tax=Salvia divinorum TaxID=28513 RepID=A0ABD1GID8_SALDI